MSLELVALLAAGIFAGAATYVSIVEHPARVSAGAGVALAEFRPSYGRASIMQASLAVLGGVAGVARWWVGGSSGWLVGGLALGAVVPFTLIIVMPTNARLLDASRQFEDAEVLALLRRWGRLHAIRTVASLLAFALFAALVVRR
jgi:hypothetical protein